MKRSIAMYSVLRGITLMIRPVAAMPPWINNKTLLPLHIREQHCASRFMGPGILPDRVARVLLKSDLLEND